MKTLNELQPLILEWAKEKDLLKRENAPKQFLKLIEECGELCSGILKNNTELIRDSIGDVFVVLTIFSEQLGITQIPLEKTMVEYYQKPENIQLCVARIITSSDTRMVFKESTDSSIHILDCISENLGYDLTECANLAWNEIKDRKGKTVNGSFIKN